MKISEIFYSIQGEGPKAGYPAVFLRLALCNLKCTWCDTKYTWDWTRYNYDKEVTELSISQIVGAITKFRCKHLVVTGGEPLIQQEELSRLVTNLRHEGFFIEVETNGTIIPNKLMTECVNQWNVSPKLKNSGNILHGKKVASAYSLFATFENSFFKFVVRSEKDLDEIKRLAKKCHIGIEKILLMPQARTRLQLETRSPRVIKLCLKSGYKFSPRLHIQFWNGKRGT